MCFVRAWFSGFLAREMLPLLSPRSVMGELVVRSCQTRQDKRGLTILCVSCGWHMLISFFCSCLNGRESRNHFLRGKGSFVVLEVVDREVVFAIVTECAYNCHSQYLVTYTRLAVNKCDLLNEIPQISRYAVDRLVSLSSFEHDSPEQRHQSTPEFDCVDFSPLVIDLFWG